MGGVHGGGRRRVHCRACCARRRAAAACSGRRGGCGRELFSARVRGVHCGRRGHLTSQVEDGLSRGRSGSGRRRRARHRRLLTSTRNLGFGDCRDDVGWRRILWALAKFYGGVFPEMTCTQTKKYFPSPSVLDMWLRVHGGDAGETTLPASLMPPPLPPQGHTRSAAAQWRTSPAHSAVAPHGRLGGGGAVLQRRRRRPSQRPPPRHRRWHPLVVGWHPGRAAAPHARRATAIASAGWRSHLADACGGLPVTVGMLFLAVGAAASW